LPSEKARALVLRTTDWSETSRIATMWTREFGRVRVLAKGGRRLKSAFENALDLLTLCDIVLLRKSSGSLDLLTEARVVRRFQRLRDDLSALYSAYYVAELLADWTEDYDPHPRVFDEAVLTLAELGKPGVPVGPRLARFELVLLRELGHGPAVEVCAVCAAPVTGVGLAFSASAGGVVCQQCQPRQRDCRPLTPACWHALKTLAGSTEVSRQLEPAVRTELRQLLGQYITYLMGRKPRLLPYLGS
jgi:DNA repair protein RecO (recombination protein O)